MSTKITTIVGTICNHMWIEGLYAKMRTVKLPKLTVSGRLVLGLDAWRKERKQEGRGGI